MHMHYAPNERRLKARDPMCGYVAHDDEICRDASLCTCPECLDWIRPAHAEAGYFEALQSGLAEPDSGTDGGDEHG